MSNRLWLCLALLAFSPAAQGANFQVRPISADVGFVIQGNEIFLPQGLSQTAVVTFDVFVSGWATETLRGAQFWNLVSGGTGGSITPYNPSCTLEAECEVLVGPHENCNGVLCGYGFFESARSDFVFNGLPIATGSQNNYAGLTTEAINSVSDPGIAKYLGSFKMKAAPGSAGTFTISFDPAGDRTFWFNSVQTLFSPTITPAKVTFNSVVALGIPTIGTWGLVVLGLALACAGSIRLERIRTESVGVVA